MKRYRSLLPFFYIALCIQVAMTPRAHGQVVDVALHPTAVPDQYEIGIRATGPITISGVVNMILTVRWEAEAGGIIQDSWLESLCPAFRPSDNGEGVVTFGNYRYFTMIFDAFAPIDLTCPITTEERIIARFRIVDLEGCRNVALVNDAYTQSTNKDFFLSAGGVVRTGMITTDPIPGGVCAPCIPPEITSIVSSGIATCTGPVDVHVAATGTSLLYGWSWPPGANNWNNVAIAADSVHFPSGSAGVYSVVVENLCGADTASITVSPEPCDGPPEITTISGSFVDGPACSGVLELNATVNENEQCMQYRWSGPGGFWETELTPYNFTGWAGIYTLIAYSACGSDTATIEIGPDEPCTAPEIESIDILTPPCPTQPIQVHVQLSSGSPCVRYQWILPNGQASYAGVAASLPYFEGIYRLIAFNVCGSDTFYLELSEPSPVCVPPEITSVTYTAFTCYGEPVSFLATSSGTCTQRLLYSPTGALLPVTGSITIAASAGVYMLVAFNECGSDTAFIELIASVECEAPEIASFMHSPVDCLGEPTMIHAAFRGTCTQRDLHTPSGAQLPFNDSLWVDAELGTYMLVATNGCGSDTVYFTLTVPNCIPPQILSQWGDTVLCAGFELRLQPILQDTGCYVVQWEYPSAPTNTYNDLLRRFLTPATGTYAFTVTNSCGSASIAMNVVAEPGIVQGQMHCSTDTVIDLNASLPDGFPDGQWEVNGVPHSNLVYPAVDSTGQYLYHTVGNEAGCGEARIDIQIAYPFDPGTNSSVALCSNDAPIALIDYVGGTPDTGGTFTYGMLPAYFGDIYNPAVDWPRTFRYSHYGPCGYVQSLLNVTETHATTWYLDADADGLGDSAVMVLSCDTVVGHVANNSDECPLAYGTIGSPCDDEIPWTTNDVLTADCTCIGDLTTDLTGTDEKSEFSIWPNPNSTGHLFFRMAQTLPGSTEITVHNMIGEAVIVSRLRSSVDGKTYLLDVTDLAAGPYQVTVRNGTMRSSARFIITR